MATETDTILNKIKDEPELEIEEFEPKQEENTNSFLITEVCKLYEPKLELTETDIKSVYEETQNQIEVKQEEKLIPFLFAQDDQTQTFPDDKTRIINRSGAELRVIISEADQYTVLNYKMKDISKKCKSWNRHNHNLKLFKCNQCSFATKWKNNLSRHIQGHLDLSELKCDQCSYVAKWKDSFLIHKKVHHGSEEFKCDQCAFTTKLKRYLLKHVKLNHSSVELKCYQCNFVTKSREKLLKHIKIHHYRLGKIKCQYCSYVTKFSGNLWKHIKGIHSSVELKCDQCTFTTKWKTTLLLHMKAHDGTKKFKCHSCSFTTNWRSCLRKHLKRHLRSEKV